MHYSRWARTGSTGPIEPMRADYKTIRGYVDHYTGPLNENGCRLWQGVLNEEGYAINCRERGAEGKFAHRVRYELETGEKLSLHDTLHHKCGVKSCVEISHLQRISRRENIAEMLERRYYVGRIAELEAENAVLRQEISDLKERSLSYV